MSMNFQNPIDEATEERLKELFGKDFFVSTDRKKALFSSYQEIKSRDMTEIANANGGPVEVEIHEQGDIVDLGDAKYKVTPRGWRKLPND